MRILIALAQGVQQSQLKEMQLDHHRFHSYKHTTRGAVVVLLIVFINIYIYKYLYNTAKVKKFLKTLFTRGKKKKMILVHIYIHKLHKKYKGPAAGRRALFCTSFLGGIFCFVCIYKKREALGVNTRKEEEEESFTQR